MSDFVKLSAMINDTLANEQLSLNTKMEKISGLQFHVGPHELIHALTLSLATKDGYTRTLEGTLRRKEEHIALLIASMGDGSAKSVADDDTADRTL